jgi:uncharacterized protein (TIGR03435 family)
MPPARTLAALCSLLALTASAQTSTQSGDPANTAVVRVFHPTPPLPSYDVATIKPWDPAALGRNGDYSTGDTARELIREAYSGTTMSLPPTQVIGGPSWIDKEQFKIDGKPPADLDLAMRNMTYAERFRNIHAMQQSLLADRFHLKAHFEVREMPIYALVPAKGGLKLKRVAAPPPHDFSAPAPSQPSQSPAPETANVGSTANGTTYVHARAISMARLITTLSGNLHQTGDRPVADETGFAGYFDIDDLRWANAEAADAGTASDAPSLEKALETTLGLRLILTRGPVEVLVIDSIDHPSEN